MDRLRMALIGAALCISAAALAGPTDIKDQLIDFLLGRQNDATGLDVNDDGRVDVADLIAAGGEPSGGDDITPQQRMETIGAVEQQFASVLDLGLDAQNEALVAWLETQPLIFAAGITEDSTVWAVFNDGEPLMIVNNRGRGEPAPAAAPALLSSLPEASALPRASTPITPREQIALQPQQIIPGFDPIWNHADMPQGRKAEVLSSVGTGFRSYILALGLEDLLRELGYQIGPVTNLASRTVPDYRNLKNVDVLYMTGHGSRGMFATFPQLGNAVFGSFFAVSTEDVVDAADYTAYRSDIDNRNLVPIVAIYYEDNAGNPVTETHWGLTADFFSTHVTFGPSTDSFGRGALVIMDACGTGDTRLSDACFDGGAAVYYGWAHPVRDFPSTDSTEHFLSRLLGDRPPVGEAVRPFDIDLTEEAMIRKGLNIVEGSTSNFPAVPLVLVRSEQSQLAILRPMLHTLRVFPKSKELHLFGMFTTDVPQNTRPMVSVDGRDLAVTGWDPHELICTLPSSGAGSKGEVIVTINGVKSEAIFLREWTGNFSYELSTDELGQYASGNGTMRFRAGVDPYRLRPDDEDPVFPWASLAGIDPTDPDLIRFFFQHPDFIVSPMLSIEDDSTFKYAYEGDYPAFCSGNPAVVSGAGSLNPIVLDPGELLPMIETMGFVALPTFLTFPGTTSVDWLVTIGVFGGDTARVTYPADCEIPPQDDDLLRSLNNELGDAPINTESFIIPRNTVDDGKILFRWDQMAPDPPFSP